MALNDDQIQSLLHASALTHDEEIDCDVFLEHMAAYAEWRLAGGERTLPASLVLAARHERICPTCHEECAALMEAIAPGEPER